MKKFLYCIPLLLLLPACEQPENFQKAYDSINQKEIKARIKTLASNDFMGRMPFTEGETITINYIRDEFKKMGLEPGDNGSYFQEVPLVEITANVDPIMTINGGKKTIELKFWDDFVALTRRVTDKIEIKNSELVFAGYGIVAPEYDWNDYDGLDLKGKTAVVLVNDPGFGSDDKSFFKGNEMTYYGRWTYKYEEAARQGAEGLIIIHETDHASYPFAVVQGGWTGPNLYLESADGNKSRCAMEGWISYESAEKLFANMGMEDYDFYKEARKRDFKAFDMNQQLSVKFSTSIKRSKSNNVVAIYKGTDLADEVIIYSAHWDHFGYGKPVDGDSIYNGAVDNGTGVAAILQVAEAFTKLNNRTRRSVVFMAVTAEEQGLLGSAYYAEHPIYPPEKTVANINVDAIGPIGRVNDFSIVGYGQSELEDYAEVAVKKQGRYITPDARPEAGSFFRSDHFNFGKIGIPALYGKGGYDSAEHGKVWGKKQAEIYVSEHYHKPSDEYSENFDAAGVVLDSQVYFEVGYTLANESSFPKWKEGSEFKAIREGK